MGESHLTASAAPLTREPLVSKDSSPSQIIRRRGPTIVKGQTLLGLIGRGAEGLPLPVAATPPFPRPRPPNARDAWAASGKQKRRQRKRETFSDAAAFAYFQEWPLDMRITVAWDVCLHKGDHDEGHVLLQPDEERSKYLRDALWRRLRKHGKVFACIWARDEGGQQGQHIHLGLHWPLPLRDLAWLLARVTGSRPASGPLPRGVVAQSECGGWQIKRNTAQDEIRSARTWTDYLTGQEERHLIAPDIKGQNLGFSRAIDARAIAPWKEELETWKREVGWNASEAA